MFLLQPRDRPCAAGRTHAAGKGDRRVRLASAVEPGALCLRVARVACGGAAAAGPAEGALPARDTACHRCLTHLRETGMYGPEASSSTRPMQPAYSAASPSRSAPTPSVLSPGL